MLKFLLIALSITFCLPSTLAAEPLANSTVITINSDTTLEDIPASSSGPQAQNLENDHVQPTAITTEQTLEAIAESNREFVKIDSSGEVLEYDSEYWDCTHQKQTGLTWEVKTNSDLRNKSNTYTWVAEGSDTGAFTAWFDQSQGKCTGDARCDTDNYITTINQQKLCNFSDWRLPTKEELLTLIDYSTNSNEPAINKKYFPNTLPSWYWTSTTNNELPEYAWYILFRNNGLTLNDLKNKPKHIRLVRGTIKS